MDESFFSKLEKNRERVAEKFIAIHGILFKNAPTNLKISTVSIKFVENAKVIFSIIFIR